MFPKIQSASHTKTISNSASTDSYTSLVYDISADTLLWTIIRKVNTIAAVDETFHDDVVIDDQDSLIRSPPNSSPPAPKSCYSCLHATVHVCFSLKIRVSPIKYVFLS